MCIRDRLWIKSPTRGIFFAVVLCSSRLWTACIFPSFNILLQSIFIGSLSRQVLLNILYWTSLSRWSKIRVINVRYLTILYLVNLINFEPIDVFRIKQHWSVPKIIKIGRLVLMIWAENVGLQYVLAPLFWPTLDNADDLESSITSNHPSSTFCVAS